MDQTIKKQERKISPYRIVEVSIILVFLAASIVTAVLAAPLQQQGIVEAADPDSLEAVISYMPIQGWTPLQVYFSADDSYSRNGRIIKYEWDLDGNGRFDTDATDTGGYASYNYLDNGNYGNY